MNDRELLISHTDAINLNGTKIGIYNISTKKEILHDIGKEIVMIAYVDDLLYVLTRRQQILSYKIQGSRMEKLNEINGKIGELSIISTIFGNIKK